MSEHFEGHEGRECGEHRTVGYRAWCFTCSEWCYPRVPCKGCELPKLRAAIEDVLSDPVMHSPLGEPLVRVADVRAALDTPTGGED